MVGILREVPTVRRMPKPTERSGTRALGSAGVLTLAKGLRILEAVGERPQGITLAELVRSLPFNKSTLFRFLTTLQQAGYADRIPGSDRYRLGARVLKLAGEMLDALPMRDVASPHLVELMLSTGETSHVSILDDAEVVYIDKVDSPQRVRLHSWVGLRMRAHSTAAGKAMLAHLPEAELQRVLAGGLPARTPHTITSERALRKQLAEIRTDGYAIDDEEETPEIRCVGAPIFGLDRKVIGAVSVSGPATRLSLERAHEIAPAVVAAAQQISTRLGYRFEPAQQGTQREHAPGGQPTSGGSRWAAPRAAAARPRPRRRRSAGASAASGDEVPMDRG